MIAALSVLLVVLLVSVQGKYFRLEGERCDVLANSTAMFNKLLPCGQYTVDPVDLTCLNDQQTSAALKSIPEWTLTKDATLGDSIKRSFLFADFQTAFYFMTQSAQLAEKNQHHPNWSNLYNSVDVILTTDDKACLSTFDIEFAQAMDIVAAPLLPANKQQQ